jgi:hypothetical protein
LNYSCWERGCKPARQSPKNFPTNKIFLPHIPRFGAGVLHPLNSLRPTQFTCFSLFKKSPVEGSRILWVGNNHAPTSDPAKKWAVKDGDFCFRHFNPSPDGNAHRFRTPQISEQQPFNLPDPESAGKIISDSSLLGNSPCWSVSPAAGRRARMRQIFRLIPTSCEFLTSGSRARQRVGFRLASQYHETSVLGTTWAGLPSA